MGAYVNRGNGSFASARKSKIYVDKTGLLEYINEVLGTEQRYICNNRPRRFGKSVTAGILPIKKYKNESALNNFREFTMANPRQFSKYIGFTRQEVMELCETYHMDFKEAARWYADIVFLPRRNSGKPAMVIEMKYDKSAKSAIAQIREKKYPEALKDYQGNLLLAGVSYDREDKKHSLLFTAWEPLIVTFGAIFQVLLRKNRPSHLNHVLTECAVHAHSWPVNSNKHLCVIEEMDFHVLTKE